jgi:RimJ/RimL family protein N-acetyltransferase
VNITRLGPDDTDAYIALRRESLLDAPWSFASSPAEDRGSDPDNVRRTLASDDFAVFAARAAPAPAAPPGPLASIAMVNRETRVKRRHIAWIMGVYTTPAFRGQGLARSTVAACLAHARAWPGVEVVQLGVSSRAPDARRLYERLGFIAWGTEPDAIRVGESSFDEVHMALRLRH